MKSKMRWMFPIAVIAGSVCAAQQPIAVNAVLQLPMPMQINVPVAGGQVKDDLFAGTEKFAKGASDVTEVNLDPKMMGMVGDNHGPDAGLARKMRYMVIHTYKYDKPGMYNMDDFDAYRKKLEDGSWSCSIHVRDKRGSTDICSREAADHQSSEMVILTAKPQELTFIHMSGHMSLDDLNNMGPGMGGPPRHKDKDKDKDDQ